MTPNRLTELLAEEIVLTTLVPWACPSAFGPDGRYRLEEVVGASPHSLVYRATDTRLSDDGFSAVVAVKVHRPTPSSKRTEAVKLRRIRHANVLMVQDSGVTEDGYEYIVTDYLDGSTLAEWRRPDSIREIACILERIARGVQAAHAAGVCHLDLKPSNILIAGDGQPKVADFGIARTLGSDSPGSGCEPGRGNLAFMSPEQFFGKENADAPSSDVYALGGLLYWMLSGNLPNGVMEEEITRTHHEHPEKKMPCRDRVLSAICLKALSHDPAERQASAGRLADELVAWMERRPIDWLAQSPRSLLALWLRRNRLLATVGALALTALTSGFATAWWMNESRHRAELSDKELTIAAEAEGRLIAEKEIEAIKARMRQQITTFAHTLFARSPANLPSSLVWLLWLDNITIVGEDGTHAANDAIVQVLEGVIAERMSEGASGSIESLMARHALAFVSIQRDDDTGARFQLNKIRRIWTGVIPAADPIWNQVAALEDCALALDRTGHTSEAARNAARDSIREWSGRPEASGPIDRLGQEVLRRIGKQRRP